MKTAAQLDRRAILSLIAMGRITAREAERLLAMLEDSDDAMLRFAAVLAVAWIGLRQGHELAMGVVHAVSMVAPRVAALAPSVVAFVTQVFGGVR